MLKKVVSGSEELSCSDGEGKGSVNLFDSSDEDIQGGLLKRNSDVLLCLLVGMNDLVTA